MPQSFSPLRRAVLAVAAALSLAACHRAEYATLPKSPAYLGSAYARPVAPAEAPAPAAALGPAVAPARLAPAVSKAPRAVAAAPAAQPRLTAPAATAPLASAPAPIIAAVPPVAPARPSLAQRLLLKRVSKRLGTLMAQAPQLKQSDATAGTARISGNLRTGIILVVIGLLIGLLNGFIGTVIALIGLVFIVLWLLDEL